MEDPAELQAKLERAQDEVEKILDIWLQRALSAERLAVRRGRESIS
jgi:hypothetical protein